MRITQYLSIILMFFFLINSNCVAKPDNDITQIFDLMKCNEWKQAYDMATKVGDSALKKIVLSQQYQDTKYRENSFGKIASFLIKNPLWPQNDLLQICAENLINNQTNKALIVKFFTKRSPLTGNGHKYYAMAAAFILSDPDKLASIIKLGWQKGAFTDKEQNAYYKKFSTYLTQRDHVKKIDNLLWQNEIQAAKNDLHYVNNKYKKSFNAQIALIRQHKKSISLFRNVDKKHYTSGLIYRYLCARKSDLPSSAEIVELSKIIQKDKGNDLWPVQSYLAREFIEKKKYLDAYRVVSNHCATSAAAKSDAEHLSGWIALNYLRNIDLALKHFQCFNHIVKTPISRARGLYWLARAYDYKNHKEQARALYAAASRRYPYTFYGQMSAIELKQKQIVLPNITNLTKQNQDIETYIKNHEMARAAQIVTKYGSHTLGRTYVRAAIASIKQTADIYKLVYAIAKVQCTHKNAWAARIALEQHVFIQDSLYPRPYTLQNTPVEKALIYSIIRQESIFDQYAISNAQARGLMQLIDKTAHETAALIGIKCNIGKLLIDPHYNIKLGSHYISQMINEYHGSYILALAAYNGGPHNVDKWIPKFGDPRKFKSHREVLNWLEHIPFYETRNYVQRVLENLQIYRLILNKDHQLSLRGDLLRYNKDRKG